jgi:hypothetical protein
MKTGHCKGYIPFVIYVNLVAILTRRVMAGGYFISIRT